MPTTLRRSFYFSNVRVIDSSKFPSSEEGCSSNECTGNPKDYRSSTEVIIPYCKCKLECNVKASAKLWVGIAN